MKNRKLLLVVSLVLALTMSLGGTLAYLTDTDEAVNVMTLGNVDIEQLENGKEEDGFENGQPLYPAYYTTDENGAITGDIKGVLEKTVTVKNTGKSDAYVRTWIAMEAGNLTTENFDSIIHAEFGGKGYTLSDAKIETILGVNYYVVCATYNDALAEAQTTDPSLVKVYMDKVAGNDDVAQFGDTYEILVISQACQTINMPENPTEALNIAFTEKHPWSDWNGTSNEPAGNIIASKADLLALSGKPVNGTYTLMANIDMGGEEFRAIIVDRSKELVINGNGYTISNAKVVSGDGDNTTGQASMFYCFPGSTLTVSDLTLKNLVVNADENGSGYAAAVVGYCEGKAVLNNVDVVNATVTGTKSSGMLVGHLSAGGSLNATACDVTGTVVLTDYEAGGHYAGKYIGTIADDVALKDCASNVKISGNLKNTNNGDVYGRIVSGDLKVENLGVIVSSKEDLLTLSAKALTGNNNVAESMFIEITADIDMKGAEFSAIIAQRGDTLVINGNDHTISNVNIVSGANDNTTGQASMFYAYPNSTLKVSDLTLKDVTVTSDADGAGYAAAIIGYCEGNAILDNVDVVNAKVVGVKSSGMLIGHLSGSLKATDCDLTGTVTLAQYDGEPNGYYAGKYIGTLAGSATLDNCKVNATVSGNLKEDNLGEIYGRKTAAGSLN